MKRGKPLERKTALKRGEKPLRASVEKVREFQQRGRVRAAEAARSKSRTPLAKVGKAPRGKAAEALSPQQAKARRVFGMAARGQPCANPRCRATRHVEAAHVLPQQTIRRICRTLGLDPHDYLWDRRNMLPLCSDPAPNRCHERHDNHVDGFMLPHTIVPAGAIDFCEELDDMLEAFGRGREAMAKLSREWA